MTMSMYSSYTATDEFPPEEDIYGERRAVGLPRMTDRGTTGLV